MVGKMTARKEKMEMEVCMIIGVGAILYWDVLLNP